jgi:hypothetical protein
MNAQRRNDQRDPSRHRRQSHPYKSVESRETHSERPGEVLHLKLFLRHVCPECSEMAVAEEVRQLHHLERVQAHPERHELEVWVRFPEQGLLRQILGLLRLFCCELRACHVR